ncbi:MAG: bifunctional adenosylcobinamide kinase/adenosylcobinamide-phosphate guanylyltransferase [Candidatus Obscuribacterales bacterium]|nr:bifunctional adenosylcobinamide kinase/adenosylcobinamide-phosphate guanylyltransferase [Candidatus Obscuribacterales bacterium]
MKNLTFITGAVRSGKSLLAEELATKSGKPVYYLASMQILGEDPEQIRRLELHRARRPAEWKTIDAAFNLQQTIPDLPAQNACAIFDCLSLYITNMMIDTTGSGKEEGNPYDKENEIMSQIKLLLDAMAQRPDIEFIVVSNEVGWGVVPETVLGRAFRDFLGLANQQFAAQAQRAFLSCAGLRLQLK